MAEKYTFLQKFIINALRRSSLRWPSKNTAKARARVQHGLYECNICKIRVGPKAIDVDHIEPVIDPITGFQNYDIFIERLFCGPENLQVLCKPCHKLKSKEENRIRRLNK